MWSVQLHARYVFLVQMLVQICFWCMKVFLMPFLWKSNSISFCLPRRVDECENDIQVKVFECRNRYCMNVWRKTHKMQMEKESELVCTGFGCWKNQLLTFEGHATVLSVFASFKLHVHAGLFASYILYSIKHFSKLSHPSNCVSFWFVIFDNSSWCFTHNRTCNACVKMTVRYFDDYSFTSYECFFSL